jgi:hypothetical protein
MQLQTFYLTGHEFTDVNIQPQIETLDRLVHEACRGHSPNRRCQLQSESAPIAYFSKSGATLLPPSINYKPDPCYTSQGLCQTQLAPLLQHNDPHIWATKYMIQRTGSRRYDCPRNREIHDSRH